MLISFRIVLGLTIPLTLISTLSLGQATPPSADTYVSRTATASSVVPSLVKFSGTVKDAQGKPLSGMVGITFALYKDQQGGAPLWQETQNVTLDASGRYTVQLGSSLPGGLPLEVFVSGEARWLGVQAEGQAEQSRVLLLSVPYALKAGDAETIGGLPPSAFVLATPGAAPSTAAAAPSTSSNSSAPPANPAVTGLGTVSFIPLWDTTSDIVNSVLFQSGSGTAAKVGINTTTPSTTLDVKGSGTIRGSLTMPTTGTATATAGKNSQPVVQVASSFNSSTHAAVNETFRWQAEPTANNTANPSATLNLLFGAGTASPTETGLKISNTGIFTFTDTQTFPGTGTLTGLTAGAGMTGGGTSGTVTLGLTSSCSNGQVLQWNGTTWVCTTLSSGGTITGVTAGTDLSGGGTTGNVTLNLDTTKVPQLAAANTFTANQAVTGNVTASGTVTGSVVNAATTFDLGGVSFAYGSPTLGNMFLGFLAGNSTTTGTSNVATGSYALAANTTGGLNSATGWEALSANTTGGSNTANGGFALESNNTGSNNTAIGGQALQVNTSGNQNTASGALALANNSTGSSNTAFGMNALQQNTTGSSNTAVGYNAGPDSTQPGLTNATAIGANAVVSESNALVLGGTGVNAVSVGIGTATPTATLDVHGTGNFTGPITFAAGQTFPGVGTITGVTPGTALTGGGSTGSVTLNVDTTKVVTGITAGTDLTGGGTGGVQTLNLDTTKVPQLNAANTFTGNQTVNGNLTATAAVSAGSYQLGVYAFANGSFALGNAFLGFAGNITTTGNNNTASGFGSMNYNTTGSSNTGNGSGALLFNTTGSFNTATGAGSLFNNTTGIYNTATGGNALIANTTGSDNTANGTGSLTYNTTGDNNTACGEAALWSNTTGSYNSLTGQFAMYYNTTGSANSGIGASSLVNNLTGSYNSGFGYSAGPDSGHTGLLNATAVGAFAQVSESNALVLGSINGVNSSTADTNVGIGTTAPASTLDVEANAAAGSGPTLLLKNKAAIASGTTGNAVDLRFAPDGGSGVVNPNAYMRVQEDGSSQYGAFMSFATMADGGAGAGAIERMRIAANGNIGIGTASPDALLSVNGSADKSGGGSWGTFSDGRLKNLNGNFQSGLSEILKLHPIRYRYKEENAMGIRDHDEHIGFVAQDVQKVIPEAVTENSRGYLLVNNDPILWAMLNAIQEQQDQIRAQRQQIRTQQRQIVSLNSKMGVLEAALRTTGHAGKSSAVVPSSNRTHGLSLAKTKVLNQPNN